MRIGFVTQEYPPELGGGAGTYAFRLVSSLSELGHEIVVFVPLANDRPNRFLQGKGIKLVPISIPNLPFAMAFYWLKLRRAVKREGANEKFDVIHVNAPTCWVPSKRRLISAPQILTIHHLSMDIEYNDNSGSRPSVLGARGENNLLVRFFEGRCVRTSDKIVAVSDFTKRRLEARYPSTANKIVTIHEAPDPVPPHTPNEAKPWKETLGIDSKKIVLFVGRLNDPRKGLDLLLTALSERPDFPEYVLLIVGKGDPEPIKRMANGLGLSDRIRLLGFVESGDLWELYNLCDLYVVPSRLEGFGLTVLDAAAAGKRVVATRVGAIPEIGGPGTVLVEPNNSIALADAINAALLDDAPLYGAIREHASHFSWSKVARATEQVYNGARDASHELYKGTHKG